MAGPAATRLAPGVWRIPTAVKDLVKEAMEIVKVSNADKHNGLAPKELLGVYESNLALFDESHARTRRGHRPFLRRDGRRDMAMSEGALYVYRRAWETRHGAAGRDTASGG